MILSVSRRTDIPNYYSDWFFNRLREGFLYVRNPMNPHQISRISLSAQVVDCIVFWTKNPGPMLERLEELKEYPFYFQFTLTGYGTDIEPGVLHKKEEMIRVFQRFRKKSEAAASSGGTIRFCSIGYILRSTTEKHFLRSPPR